MAQIHKLGVLLCYNDADVLEDAARALLESGHDLIAWDHGSNDGTAAVLDRLAGSLLERRFVPREFDFYQLYQTMSRHLIENHAAQYDWISWPDQDEILEGADRTKPYAEHVREVLESPFDWVVWWNVNFWLTAEDDPAIASPIQRVRRYSVFKDCAPRIRGWRASSTNIRLFNHNAPLGKRFPRNFNLRHYPMRTPEQMERRISKDRAGLQRGNANYHYNAMAANPGGLVIEPSALHLDDGVSELNLTPVFDWRSIYGRAS